MRRIYGECTGELPHRSGILQSQKIERNLIAGEDSYLEEHNLYIRGDGVLVSTESQNYKINVWGRSGPTNKDLFKDVL